MEEVDVVIVGGGFAGMCAARAIGRLGKKVLVLEARTGSDPRFRGELMHPPAVEVLRELDLLEALVADGGVMVDGFATVLGEGKSLVELPYAEAGGPSCKGFSMEHPKMVACFRREIGRDSGVTLRTGVKVHELLLQDSKVVGVRTDEGDIYAPLTVVADGRHSKLRKSLGFPENTRLLSYTAALLVEDGELPRPGHGHVFYGPFGPILAYPIDGGRVRMCIDVPVDVEKGRENVVAFLRDHCAPHVPSPLRAAMERALDVHELEMCATHSISTRRCAARGVVLIGDSCGCAHPITAAGMMVALHDIAVLSDELGQESDLDKVLLRYQDRRYEFVRAREILTDGLYDVFRLDDPGAQAMRDGLQEYWTSGPKARAASMALLAGLESRLVSFIAEYFSVVGRSARAVAGKGLPGLSGLGRTARTQLVRTSELVLNDLRRRLPVQTQLVFGARVAERLLGRGVDHASAPS
ncbi:MAG: FAD-dependent monooxygenase [Polyangiaceae bacterium]